MQRLWLKIFLLFAILIALAVVLVAGYRLAAGTSLGLGTSVKGTYNAARAVIDRSQVRSQSNEDFTNIIFLHHSVGQNLIAQGQLRERLTQTGFQFWDQNYNYLGLTGADGRPRGYAYNVPNDNTDPGGLATLFSQPELPLPVNALSGLLQHDVIIIKSCYTANQITSQEQLNTYQDGYLQIRAVMARHPEKIFIILTAPPLNPQESTLEISQRARTFASWLASEDFRSGYGNIFIFDVFDQLAEPDGDSPEANMLREEYRNGGDSHPNTLANQTLGLRLVDFIVEAVHTYQGEISDQ